jgi:hypothetical protein
MALGTLGTTLTTSLSSLVFDGNSSGSIPPPSPLDFGNFAALVKDDANVAHPIWPGAFGPMGLLYVPNRGVLKVLPGDYVGVDANGWPVLVSSYSVATGGWSHVP